MKFKYQRRYLHSLASTLSYLREGKFGRRAEPGRHAKVPELATSQMRGSIAVKVKKEVSFFRTDKAVSNTHLPSSNLPIIAEL